MRTPARRSQAQRSAATRLALFRTTLKVLIERGYASLRTAEIVERSGLSKGALLHHFPTKDDLLIAAAEFAMEEALAAERARVAVAAESADPLAALVEAQRAFYFGTFALIQWELQVAARTDRKLGRRLDEIAEAYRRARDAAWTEVLVAHGIPAGAAAVALDMTLSLWRGYGVRYFRDRSRLAQLRRDGDAIAEVWHDMLHRYLEAS